jgi:hypothetical protein
MTPDYSKAALVRFLDTAGSQGLLNSNTLSGWRAAVARILEDVTDDVDVRTIDVVTAIKRYHNKQPGVLKGNSLKEYERRLTRALADFAVFTDDPTKYAGRGRGPSEAGNSNAKGDKAGKRRPQVSARTPMSPAPAATPSAVVGLSLEFPIRPDFLASIIVPRDMKVHEARRLASFIMTLASDYVPKVEID